MGSAHGWTPSTLMPMRAKAVRTRDSSAASQSCSGEMLFKFAVLDDQARVQHLKDRAGPSRLRSVAASVARLSGFCAVTVSICRSLPRVTKNDPPS